MTTMNIQNSTDATQGQPLVKRAITRKAELEQALAALPASDARERTDLEMALSAIRPLLTGDRAHPSDTTAAAINSWLESSKHLAEKASTTTPQHD